MAKRIKLRLVSPDDNGPLAPIDQANKHLQECGLGMASVEDGQTLANEPAEAAVREFANEAAAPLIEQAAAKRTAADDDFAKIAESHAARLVEQYKNRQPANEDVQKSITKWGVVGTAIVNLAAAVFSLLKELLAKG